eukprot:4162639-Prymnesium_polylepis.2
MAERGWSALPHRFTPPCVAGERYGEIHWRVHSLEISPKRREPEEDEGGHDAPLRRREPSDAPRAEQGDDDGLRG